MIGPYGYRSPPSGCAWSSDGSRSHKANLASSRRAEAVARRHPLLIGNRLGTHLYADAEHASPENVESISVGTATDRGRSTSKSRWGDGPYLCREVRLSDDSESLQVDAGQPGAGMACVSHPQTRVAATTRPVPRPEAGPVVYQPPQLGEQHTTALVSSQLEYSLARLGVNAFARTKLVYPSP